jgi:L-lactate dehydrogenase (cytochrome)|tara:strand:+ start:2519 stop:3649 length:1131 start_codon:yes stop_codon:yes gene_type:complete
MDYHSKFPAVSDLKKRAQKRIPHFVWEYLDSGTGLENTRKRNRAKLDEVMFYPSVLHGDIKPDLKTTILNHEYGLPFGIAPVGMSGLIWPNAEKILARTAAGSNIPYTLSTVASQSPEDLAPHIDKNAWFQLYPPRDAEILDDILKRVRDSGFTTLVLTVDVPDASRREKQIRGGLTHPPRLTGRLGLQAISKPVWLANTLRNGIPKMKLMQSYSNERKSLSSTAHIGYLLRTSPDINYLRDLRKKWKGNLVVKGVMRAEDARSLEQEGVNAIWVSNHAGRQFDGTYSSIEVLPKIRKVTKLPIIFDSGIEGGLDILRALSSGADFVMMGGAWHYSLGAMGTKGPNHLIDILTKDLIANMGQLGLQGISDLKNKTI